MNLNLPPHIEALAREKAAQAGLPDVDTFVHRLIENAAPEQALLPPHDNPDIVAAISEGLASTIEGKMDHAFWEARREKLAEYLNSKRAPES